MKFNMLKNYGLRLRDQRESLSHRRHIGRLSIRWRQLDNKENINEPEPNLRLHQIACLVLRSGHGKLLIIQIAQPDPIISRALYKYRIVISKKRIFSLPCY